MQRIETFFFNCQSDSKSLILDIKIISMVKFTALIEKSEDGWYVGQIEEMPAAISQGKTVDELKINLADAVILLIETNRELMEKEYAGKRVMKEDIFVSV